MSRRIQRDTHKKVSSTGYQKMQGDLEVQGNLLGPAITNINAAIAKISATSTTPVKLKAPQVEGIMRGIEVRWQRQYNLANFSHYELQVSDDDESWYSLLLDGSGWKGNLNEDTDVKTELFTHANIPLREDAGDLVGISLYYRVRQVTFAEVRGEWSDSAYATTKGVQDVVLTDSRNRYIEISSKKGIYADDRQGHVIHDIPNAPIMTGMTYGGHIIWMDTADYLDSITVTYTDVNTSRSYASAMINTPIVVPEGLTNIRGILLSMEMYGKIATTKANVGAYIEVWAKYSTTYDTVGSTHNVILTHKAYWGGPDGTSFYPITTAFVIIPVTENAGVKYITWRFDTDWAYMSADNLEYNVRMTPRQLGVTI